MKLSILVILTAMLFCSCSSLLKEPTPRGEEASVILKNDIEYAGELIAINDTMLFFSTNTELYGILLSDVRTIHIHGYSVKSAKIAAMTTLVLLDGVISFLFIASGQFPRGIPFVLLIPTTVVAFLKSNPKVDYSSLLTKSDREELKLYCRYPQGLTGDQWKQLLQYYKQEGFVTPPVR